MLIPIGSIKTKHRNISWEILQGKCGCKTTGYISGTISYSDNDNKYDKEVWLICPYHTGFLQALKEIEIYEFELGCKTNSGLDQS